MVIGMVKVVPQRDKRLESLLRGCQDAVLATNAEGIIQFANEAACQLTERNMSELIGESIVEVYESMEAARAANRKIYRAGGTIHDMESRTRTKSGKIIPVRISATHLYDANGKYMGGVGYFARVRPATPVELVEAEFKTRIEPMMESFKDLAKTGIRNVQTFYRNFSEKISKKD
jgi:PAS domain S-box-containing protein